MQTVILVVLIIFTLFNLYTLTIGKKRNKIANANYRKQVDALKVKATAEMKALHSFKGFVYPYVNDDNLCFILCVDHKKDLMSIVTEDSFFPMKISSPKTVEVLIDPPEGPSYNSVTCTITAPEDLEERLTLSFASKPHKRKSVLGKFILQNVEEFHQYVLGNFPTEEAPAAPATVDINASTKG